MDDRPAARSYPLEQALQAQNALRKAAGLEPELFPIQAFVGMISDEIDELRKLGRTDQDIARVIVSSSDIGITAAEIAEHYAAPHERQRPPQ